MLLLISLTLNKVMVKAMFDRINLSKYKKIVFFTGAGMSAESGVPTYRGHGGIWKEYNFQEYACQDAFDRDPEKVLEFHELRRQAVLECHPHDGHNVIAKICEEYPALVVTQNIDGMHQRAGNKEVYELHGSLWRVRCPIHGVSEDIGAVYSHKRCDECDAWLRPDITWFGDMLNEKVVTKAIEHISTCDLFINIGVSGVVYPAAGFPKLAQQEGAKTICINVEEPADSAIYDELRIGKASEVLSQSFV